VLEDALLRELVLTYGLAGRARYRKEGRRADRARRHNRGVAAVRHGSQNFPSPSMDMRLAPDDVLYLMGKTDDITRARRRISTGEAPTVP
jgi:Trk K+ transport system NAD-binding subunit